MSFTVEEAIKNNSVDLVQTLLNQIDVDTKFITREWWFNIHESVAMDQRHVDIIKLLLGHGVKVSKGLITHIFKFENFQYTKELVALFLKHTKNFGHIACTFCTLLNSKCHGKVAADILDILIYHGLPVNGFVYDSILDNFRPLHLAIMTYRMDFVLLLLERGASIHKRTLLGMTSIFLATQYTNLFAVILLVKKGICINKRNADGRTALHMAGQYNEFGADEEDILRFFLDNRADFNIKSNLPQETPFTYGNVTLSKYVLLKELAKLEFQDQKISAEHSEYIERHYELQKKFKDYLWELKMMKDCKFYNRYSLFNIFEMSKEPKKLTFLTKNDDFVEAFMKSVESLEHYRQELKIIFSKAIKRRDALGPEEEKIKTIFKDHLPSVALRKVSDYVNQDLFVDEFAGLPLVCDKDFADYNVYETPYTSGSENEDDDIEDYQIDALFYLENDNEHDKNDDFMDYQNENANEPTL